MNVWIFLIALEGNSRFLVTLFTRLQFLGYQDERGIISAQAEFIVTHMVETSDQRGHYSGKEQ